MIAGTRYWFSAVSHAGGRSPFFSWIEDRGGDGRSVQSQFADGGNQASFYRQGDRSFALWASNAADQKLPNIVNFLSLARGGNGSAKVGSLYSDQGFTIASSVYGQLYVWQAGILNFPGLAQSATSLFQFNSGATVDLTAAGNVPFTLNSIDLAPLITGGLGSLR